MSKKNPFRMVMTMACLTVALPGLAAPSAERLQKLDDALAKRFAAADSDGNGQLTRAEAKAGMPRVHEHFDAIDTAAQGYVTREQVRSFTAKSLAERRQAK